MLNVKMIAAVDEFGCMGQNNDIPWKGKHPSDFKFFRTMTSHHERPTIIMGKNTWISMGSKPLPKRRNIVVSRTKVEAENVDTYSSLEIALEQAKYDTVWLIGGENIYRAGMEYANEIYLTLIPEKVEGEGRVFFPWISPSKFKVFNYLTLEGEAGLKVVHYTRL